MGNVRKDNASVDNSRSEGSQEQPSNSVAENELADKCARFAYVCDYFSRKNIDLPPHVLDEIGRVSKLSIPDRIARMNQLNQELMKYLHAAEQDSGIRH